MIIIYFKATYFHPKASLQVLYFGAVKLCALLVRQVLLLASMLIIMIIYLNEPRTVLKGLMYWRAVKILIYMFRFIVFPTVE